jgi:type IV fimbrial biogenesis protein FimT
MNIPCQVRATGNGLDRRGHHCRFVAGFTLLDLLIAIAIGAVLVLMAVPSYRAWIADIELRDRVEALVNALSLARAEAIKRDARVNLCHSADGAQCAATGSWETGWLIYADANHNGDLDADETVIRVEGPARSGITVQGNRPVADYVSYTGLGHTRMINGALQMGTFAICRAGHNAVDVVLANGGRVRVSRTTRPCP